MMPIQTGDGRAGPFPRLLPLRVQGRTGEKKVELHINDLNVA